MTNYDTKTQCHYGAISQRTPEYIWEDFESVYESECQECGTVTTNSVCPNCDADLGDDFGCMEPSYWEYTGSKEYALEYSDTLSCFFVTKSPYYTYTALCSPCAPNAGDLDTPSDKGIKTYALGHNFFENGAPYPLFDVQTDKPVLSRVYTYHVDLDERGYFMAHVENSNDDTVISWDLPQWHCVECDNDQKDCACDDDVISPDNRFVADWDILSDYWGIMKHNRDVDGLGVHLRECGILPKDALLTLGE